MIMPLYGNLVPTLGPVLDPIRAKYNLPSVAGAIFTTDGITEIGVSGVRKKGDATPATVDDLWHLGSDTKAMTATVAGTFVVEKKLSWDVKVASFFPEIAGKIPATMQDITLAQVMKHEAGLAENLDWRALSMKGTLQEQRKAAAEMALTSPAFPPGSFHYSNTDFVLVGAILEKISGKSWEELIRQRLFQPLGMNSAGFGGLGTFGKIDQPWPHSTNGTPFPLNGPAIDIPEVMGPCGMVHCTMADWSKFLTDQLRGGSGMKALLPNEIYSAMQPDVPGNGDGYGFGWGICTRDWAGGKALGHAGSNTWNYCVCWLAPNRKFGVLVCTNQGGDAPAKAADDAAYALIQRHLAGVAAKP